MTQLKKLATSLGAVALATAVSAPATAADEVNVAFFLEWATPNMIAKAEGLYEDAMGVKVNWTNFDAGTQMTEAMLAGDIDISYSQGLAPFITAVNANAPITTVGIAVAYPATPVSLPMAPVLQKTTPPSWKARPLRFHWRPWPTTASACRCVHWMLISTV